MNRDRETTEQAAEWLHVLKTGGAAQRQAFTEWLLESRRHVRNTLLTLTLERELRNVDPERRFDVQALLAAGANDVIALRSADVAKSGVHRAWHWTRLGIAAGLGAIGLAMTIAIVSHGFRPVLTTATGEQQSVKLDDGSLVHLNTESRLRVDFSSRERGVRLLEGEALFTVERDTRRPFRVHVGKAVVQALGTQFNVDRHASSFTITVLEGRVSISNENRQQTVLGAGEEARVSNAGAIEEQATPNIKRRMAWRERHLEFQDDTLAAVAEEFNRYNRVPKLRLEGDAVRLRTYTGIFQADDPESLAQVLSEEKDLVVEQTEREIVVRQRH